MIEASSLLSTESTSVKGRKYFRKDHTGERYHRFVILRRSPDYIRPSGIKVSVWFCRCDCGVEKSVQFSHLTSGCTRSCGCLAKENNVKRSRTHGHSLVGKLSRTYRTYMAMKTRCYNIKAPNFPKYGGRGIKVCERWQNSFENFLADMGERPEGTSIDRINVDGDYEPGNCRWASAKQQQRNRTITVFLTINGETLSLAEWTERSGTPDYTIRARLSRNWSHERAVFEPLPKTENTR